MIDTGTIGPGRRVLCGLTNGPSGSDERAVPEVVVDSREAAIRYVECRLGSPPDG